MNLRGARTFLNIGAPQTNGAADDSKEEHPMFNHESDSATASAATRRWSRPKVTALVMAALATTVSAGLIISGSVAGAATPDSDTRSFPGCPLLVESNHSDPCVGTLQRYLDEINPAYHLDVDDVFGPATRIAVLDFQGQNGLPADGNVGGTTADLIVEKAGGAPSEPTGPETQAPTAPATEPHSARPADDDTQTRCTAYTDAQVWQTSATWGRVRQQICTEFSSAQVRARVNFQTDWPSNCSLSIGIPPSLGASCPIGASSKLPVLSYKQIEMPISWQYGGGTQTGSCTFRNVIALSSTAKTWSCFGDWEPIQRGAAMRVGVSGISVDVRNDGDGLKMLPTEGISIPTP